jgi:salicylate hydroxylase
MIAPNGIKILRSLGYEPERAGTVPIHGIRFYDKHHTLTEDIVLDLESRFDAQYMSQKRSGFREELLRLATAPSDDLGIQGVLAKIVFNTSVIGSESEEGVVTLSDSPTHMADLVIGKLYCSQWALLRINC